MSLLCDEMEFLVAYERCRIMEEATTGNGVGSFIRLREASSATFQPYRPPVVERCQVRICA